jgi:predicted DNA-binding transcriptional regulator AlpA
MAHAEVEHITTAEFAELARTPEATIRYWRHIGHGPIGFKLGRRVLYRAADVQTWIESKYAEASASSSPAA